MTGKLHIALAQQDFVVGDITGNLRRIQSAIQEARAASAHLIVFPELALTGYPPEDLLLRPGFLHRAMDAFDTLRKSVNGIDVIIGHPWTEWDDDESATRYNAASWLREGEVLGRYCKKALPNYAVFDERRYFTPGGQPLVRSVAGVKVAVIVCEDLWQSDAPRRALEAGAELLVVPNASPYRLQKHEARLETLAQRHRETGLPVVYVNCVGGQDDLVFDGRSLLMGRSGQVSEPAAHCQDSLLHCAFHRSSGEFETSHWPATSAVQDERIYQVLVRGLRDYVRKNGFSQVVLGLSGGIDSALTLSLAVDALGAGQVHAVMLPSAHTSQLSLDLAREQAESLGVGYREIPIASPYQGFVDALAASFADQAADVTEENLQARIRAVILMALSNKFGWLLLATGNKSEMAVGYSTIYGDMAGGFAPIKDCYKTLVYRLAQWRNEQQGDETGLAIPRGVLERAPSAELAPDQTDQDTLPPYDELDAILERYVDEDQSIHEIVAAGFDEQTVRRVAGLVLLNEYKRRQAAPGVRITKKAFGRDRRYPITSGWRDSG